MEKELKLVEQRLEEIINKAGPEIRMVGSYILGNSGKRIRPALFLLTLKRPGFDFLPYIDIAAAFELLHTASLLHDDVIDQAALRRGKTTVHLKWTNKIAVLSGDFVLSQTYRILVEQRNWKLLDLVVDIVRNLAEGEVEQAFASYEHDNLEDKYFKWIGKKSASFFAGCCKAASLVAGDSAEERENWSQFGFNLGIAFQLVDDLLDYQGDNRVTGKPLYGDLHNRVMTLPLIRAYKTADPGTVQLLKGYLSDSEDDSLSQQVVNVVLAGDGLEYTARRAEYYASQALTLLDRIELNDPEKKKVLTGLVNDLLKRRK